MFDERLLEKEHIDSAIHRYFREQPKHVPARSAFLIKDNQRLPAKYILRLAFEELTGNFPNSEQITGGKASVKILRELGYEAIYEKVARKGNRNEIKSKRREAFKKILIKKWGNVETEYKFSNLLVPNFHERNSIDLDLLNILNAIESERNIAVQGRFNHKLACDFFLTEWNLIIEFDERQHFTPLRVASLLAYPKNVRLGFDKQRWINLSLHIKAGDNSPIYRDEQRAFYDSIRDIIAPRIGLKPLVRVFEEDVFWESNPDTPEAHEILNNIQNIIDN